jgi:hypothetical protein
MEPADGGEEQRDRRLVLVTPSPKPAVLKPEALRVCGKRNESESSSPGRDRPVSKTSIRNARIRASPQLPVVRESGGHKRTSARAGRAARLAARCGAGRPLWSASAIWLAVFSIVEMIDRFWASEFLCDESRCGGHTNLEGGRRRDGCEGQWQFGEQTARRGAARARCGPAVRARARCGRRRRERRKRRGGTIRDAQDRWTCVEGRRAC